MEGFISHWLGRGGWLTAPELMTLCDSPLSRANWLRSKTILGHSQNLCHTDCLALWSQPSWDVSFVNRLNDIAHLYYGKNSQTANHTLSQQAWFQWESRLDNLYFLWIHEQVMFKNHPREAWSFVQHTPSKMWIASCSKNSNKHPNICSFPFLSCFIQGLLQRKEGNKVNMRIVKPQQEYCILRAIAC